MQISESSTIATEIWPNTMATFKALDAIKIGGGDAQFCDQMIDALNYYFEPPTFDARNPSGRLDSDLFLMGLFQPCCHRHILRRKVQTLRTTSRLWPGRSNDTGNGQKNSVLVVHAVF